MAHNRISKEEFPAGFYQAMLTTERYLKSTGLPLTLVELIKTRASQLNGCGYCLDMHHKDALKAGETIQRLYLLPAWRESACYTEEEKAVLNLTDTLTLIAHEGEKVEAAFELMARHFSKEQIANIILAICQINSWNRIAITFGFEPGSYEA